MSMFVEYLVNLFRLKCCLCQKSIDILCITEHGITNNDLSEIGFPNYQILSNSSRCNHIHGGSLIMANNT